MVVEPEERRVWVLLGHDDRRSSVPAAHVGQLCPRPQLLFHTVQRRDPGAQQITDVVGPEEPLGALVQIVMMPVTARAPASAYSFGHGMRILDSGRRYLISVYSILRHLG
jgi:hypothetical protein